MAPLADLLGLQRDVAVLAFQFGDGLSNLVSPTGSAAIMAVINRVFLIRIVFCPLIHSIT